MTAYDAPQAAIGNLRFTESGVYADYLVSGQPFIFMHREWQDMVADVHAELWRTLPSGASLSGLTTPVSTRSLTRRMLLTHPEVSHAGATGGFPAQAAAWVNHCRAWEPAITRAQARRRVYWLSLPLDFGLAGNTAVGSWPSWSAATRTATAPWSTTAI